jgi:outer membrane protein OmpA-like peptidoglycan-associated protein
MNKGLVGLSVLVWTLGAASMAHGQGAFDGLDIERFKPSFDSQGMILTEAGQGELAGDLNLGFFLHYSYRPLVLRNSDGEILRSLVDDRLAASFVISMGMFDWLTVGVEVPATFWQAGANLDADGVDQGLAGAGLGDIRVAVKFTALRQEKHHISMALVVPLTLPSGDDTAFLGSESVTVAPTLALSRSLADGMLLLALNLGSWIQGAATYGDLEIGHEFFYRVGAKLNLGKKWSLLGEGQGGARLESFGKNKPKETPLEFLLAAQYHAPWDLHFTLGAAIGALPGWGTPNARGFFGLSWSPRKHDRDEDGLADDEDRCPDVAGPRDNEGCPLTDKDSDGLTDDRDGCPEQPGPVENKGCPWGDKDKDGILDNLDRCPDKAGPVDNQGCPWPDTDGDGVTDNLDRCPKKAGPADNAGCPFGDLDGDGLPDNQDKCPEVAGPAQNNGCPFSDSDGDGLKDEDDACPEQAGPIANMGCPWGDTDGDTILDNVDLCPKEKEDFDEFEDQDGCPDPDNDGDGVPDEKDKCKNEPETINGFQDEDGCPDQGKVVVIVRKEKIEILEKVYFATGKAVIKRQSFSLLNQVAQVIRGHKEIKKIRVEGHTDSQGGDKSNLRLSQRRADAVRKYLIDQGVQPDRLQAIGYGETKPIASNKTAAGREENRRVEFVIAEGSK